MQTELRNNGDALSQFTSLSIFLAHLTGVPLPVIT